MPKPHKRTRLFFTRDSDKGENLSTAFDAFFVEISTWAFKNQVNIAWKMATIAYLEGWTLESREETEECDIIALLCPSIRFNVYFYRGDEFRHEFLPAEKAMFDYSLLERVVEQEVASGSGLSA